jgi:hypothetical protein
MVIKAPNAPAYRTRVVCGIGVKAVVWPRYGREHMGLKSPVFDPVLSRIFNMKY